MVSDEIFAEKLSLLKQYDHEGGNEKKMKEVAMWLFEEAKGDKKRNEAIQMIAQSLSRSQANFKIGLILYGVKPNSLPTERETADEWNSEEGVVVRKTDGSYLVAE